jgi:hypothetical protein
VWLALLAAACGAVNLTKPVHVDDAAYLAIVRWVMAHPLHPMQGLLNWADGAQPISSINQPLLYIYLQTLLQAWLGPSLLAQHALMALVSAGVVVVFYRLARAVGAQQPLWLTALLVLGPAFLPGQNLMMDVPALLCWLVCLWALLGAGGRWGTGRLALGAAALAAGLLIKYTSLVLLPIFIFALLRQGQRRRLWLLLIPLGVLTAWSLFNLWDYGAIHILTRPVDTGSLRHTLAEAASWVGGLGALAPFTLSFAGRLPARRWLWLALAGLGAAVTVALGVHTHSLLLGVEWGLFVANGGLALALAAWAARAGNWRLLAAPTDQVLLLWLAGAAAFAILFAPFMAARHILLALPAVLLLLGRAWRVGPRLAAAGLAVTVALGGWLAISDYALAAVYPAQASSLAAALPAGGTHWIIGHWGWQWYGEQAGLVSYDVQTSRLAPGDALVSPSVPHHQTLRPADQQRLARVRTVIVAAAPLTWLRSMSATPWGGYYSFSIGDGAPPYPWSTAPLETFEIYEVR